MVRRPVTRAELEHTLAAIAPGADRLDADAVRSAVRITLRWLAQVQPGHTVEIRVPPHAAVQVVDGPRHTRGTPANVVETDALTWLALVAGDLSWAQAVASGRATASGTRADLAGLLPLRPAGHGW